MSLVDQMTEADWQRFHDAVTPDGACLLWRPHQSARTSPKFRLSGRYENPRRIAYAAANPQECDPAYVRVLCRNHKCVNAEHLVSSEASSGCLTAEEELARFMAHVDKGAPAPRHAPELGGCWQWGGYLNDGGYGQFKLGSKFCLAHRAMAKILDIEMPQGMYVDHLCHNRSCVNPQHTRLVTPAENSQNRLPGNVAAGSGLRGVHRNRNSGWKATVTVEGVVSYLGHFATPQEASKVASDFRRAHMPYSYSDQRELEVAA